MPKFTVYVTAQVDEMFEVEAEDADNAMSAAEAMFEERDQQLPIPWTAIDATSWEYSDGGDDGMDDGT